MAERKHRHRLHFFVTDRVMQQFKTLALLAHAESQTEVLRRALDICEWILRAKRNGHQVLLRDNRGEHSIELP